MRSEKDQMTVGKEKSVVEIQFRDLPREQENTPGNPKQKEEKKEVFTKVRSRAFSDALHCLRCVENMEEEEEERRRRKWDQFSTADSDEAKEGLYLRGDRRCSSTCQLHLTLGFTFRRLELLLVEMS